MPTDTIATPSGKIERSSVGRSDGGASGRKASPVEFPSGSSGCGVRVSLLVALVVLVATPAFADESRLVVVAKDSFHPALERFAAHKRKRLETDLVSLETVLAKGEGSD